MYVNTRNIVSMTAEFSAERKIVPFFPPPIRLFIPMKNRNRRNHPVAGSFLLEEEPANLKPEQSRP